MPESNVATDSPNAASQLELIPAPASTDLAGAGPWPPAGFGPYDGAGTGVDLPRFLHALRRRWLMAAIISLPVSLTAAFTFWKLLPRTYTTTAILRLASTESKILDVRDGANANSFEVYKRTQKQLLRSRFVATAALRDNPLATPPVLQNEPDPVGWLETNLSVTFPDESEVMSV